MIYLPDVNVWIALASDRHRHHPTAKHWLETLDGGDIAFCRITELGLLRLLTNAHVMGEDILDPPGAWHVYEAFRSDFRVFFLAEPDGFNQTWQHARDQIQGGTNAWTDAYLACFAAASGATVVTFDRRFKSIAGCGILSL